MYFIKSASYFAASFQWTSQFSTWYIKSSKSVSIKLNSKREKNRYNKMKMQMTMARHFGVIEFKIDNITFPKNEMKIKDRKFKLNINKSISVFLLYIPKGLRNGRLTRK